MRLESYMQVWEPIKNRLHLASCKAFFANLRRQKQLSKPEHYVVARLYIKLLALVLIFFLAPWAWWGSIAEDIDLSLWAEDWKHLGVYLAAIALSFTGICILPFLRNGWLRVPLTIVLLTGFGLDQVILGISGHHLTLDMSETLVRESDMVAGAVHTFTNAILKASLIWIVLLYAFLLSPARHHSLGSWVALIPIAAFPLLASSSQITQGKVASFPSTYSVPAELVWSAFKSSEAKDVARDSVNYGGVLRPEIKKIVVVIDEATRGDYLGLNNALYDNTPVLSKAAGIIANFGVAVASANCSHSSRYLMRIGLQKSQIPDLKGVADRLPTIWQYAAKAGFKTVFIDTFKKFGTYHSYMNYREASQIDEFITVLDHPYYQRDVGVADKLLDLLKRDEKMFIYVNKFGTHQPYDDFFRRISLMIRLLLSVTHLSHRLVVMPFATIIKRCDGRPIIFSKEFCRQLVMTQY